MTLAELDGADSGRWLDRCSGRAARRRCWPHSAMMRRSPPSSRPRGAPTSSRRTPAACRSRCCGSRPRPWHRAGVRPRARRRRCTGLGALRRRPEARWRRQPGDVPALAKLQRELLASAIRLTRPGGVVSTQPARSPGRDRWRRRRCAAPPPDHRTGHPAAVRTRQTLGGGPYVQLWPHRHGTDAMFAAALQARSALARGQHIG